MGDAGAWVWNISVDLVSLVRYSREGLYVVR